MQESEMPFGFQSQNPDDESVRLDVWEREYGHLHSIPGSLRESPAKILLELWRSLPKLSPSPRVLDAGCGAGRNSLHLAGQGCRVEAVDSCSAALEIFRSRLSKTDCRDLVKIRRLSLAPVMPFGTGTFDIVLDLYVSCHFIETKAVSGYWKELRRILAVGGFALTAFFGTRDQYYSSLISQSSLHASSVVQDPLNGITKRLYTSRQLEEFFKPWFSIDKSISLAFDDVVQGRIYQREILGFLLQK
jgi:SAM-dependent methyltransferase